MKWCIEWVLCIFFRNFLTHSLGMLIFSSFIHCFVKHKGLSWDKKQADYDQIILVSSVFTEKRLNGLSKDKLFGFLSKGIPKSISLIESG